MFLQIGSQNLEAIPSQIAHMKEGLRALCPRRVTLSSLPTRVPMKRQEDIGDNYFGLASLSCQLCTKSMSFWASSSLGIINSSSSSSLKFPHMPQTWVGRGEAQPVGSGQESTSNLVPCVYSREKGALVIPLLL